MEKYKLEDWKKLNTELNKTKQIVEEMSKLYIIAHAQVKTILRKVQIDMDYDATNDCETSLQFVKSILEKYAHRQNDEYLSKIDASTLDKFEQNYFAIMQLIRFILIIQESKNKIDPTQLVGVHQQVSRKDTFNLRGELKKSEQRMIRTKSGHRITREKKQEVNQGLIVEAGDNIIMDQKAHSQNFKQKREHLEQTIKNQFEKMGHSVNFKKKYSKLEQYLEERKQFADLIFCQKFYDQMIEEGRVRKNEAKAIEKKNPDINKIFPDFNIKTKYMKKQVKENILKVIFDVKKELLKQYHMSNCAKMSETKEQEMIKLAKKQKPKQKVKNPQTKSSTALNFHERFKSTNRPKGDFFRNSMKSFGEADNRRTKIVSNKKLRWDQSIPHEIKTKLNNRFTLNKMPVYSK